jgi:hypothetical protein
MPQRLAMTGIIRPNLNLYESYNTCDKEVCYETRVHCESDIIIIL